MIVAPIGERAASEALLIARELRAADGSSVAWALYLGALPTAVAFTTWAYALARTSAGRSSSGRWTSSRTRCAATIR